ncbi:Sulfatase-modifying factor enzyme 1 [Pseudorhodobacter antarcticus]|jgi:formylglycine-generating enzyme required for sulfatase activity|uniref:Sulfatase-modifying factor enzyme 1 n=1 Tax=Pseudorhodobacter antarcticus TaxID=1077947 RepID=A0A1H8HBF4_9RHOB|nr:SUMF1/EgtB/PvdO family nonheme iron enzyme [Pseudorhodobacter antarcticus]SEN53354.1 Sulfatase-modifying factor enzyme 1 [Pseudorhodobacter antarcticus]
MTAANLLTPHFNASLRLWGGLGVAAVIIGAALTLSRGPDLLPPPRMAESAVILPGSAPLYVQKYEVTLAEWAVCYDAGGCNLSLRTPAGKDPATTPATGLSFVDVGEYVAWINRATGHDFRLPSVAEWEFMAAGVLPEHPDPIFTSPDLTWASSYLTAPQTKRTLRAQGTFSSTSHGIADLDGSVWEWTSDCYAGVAEGILTPDRCPAFFVAGEHIAAMSFLERDPARGGCAVGAPPAHLGMRLVSDTPV